MNTIQINTSKAYTVTVGQDLLNKIGAYLQFIPKSSQIVLISDSNVWPLYGKTVAQALREDGYAFIYSYILPAGEKSKNSKVFFDILEFLASKSISRSDYIIALGGGVVGDISGFVASCYMRGIPYIQVPTSVIACVDSSVGGKTGIDLKHGKNLVGAFYSPELVLCDTSTLSTLPPETFRDGCAEIIKIALLYDRELFNHLQENLLSFNREWVISRCIAWKKAAVETDEFDNGIRQMLNLGHTIGHSLEAASNFTLTHGCAVSTGMAIITRAGAKKDLCNQSDADAVISLLEAFQLPTRTNFSADTIYANCLTDKKRTKNAINLVVPNQIGKCSIVPTPIAELNDYIRAGL